MLLLTLTKNDYVMIGDDIRIEYHKNNGDGCFLIKIDAPKDHRITRKEHFESSVELMAAGGDYEASVLAEVLSEEHEERRRISEIRRAKQKKFKVES